MRKNKKNLCKRGLAFFLAFAMCVSTPQMVAFADEGEGTGATETVESAAEEKVTESAKADEGSAITAQDSNGTTYEVTYYAETPSNNTETGNDTNGETGDNKDTSDVQSENPSDKTVVNENASWNETVGPENDKHDVAFTGTEVTKDDEVISQDGSGSYMDKDGHEVDVNMSKEVTEESKEETVQPGDEAVKGNASETEGGSQNSVDVTVTPNDKKYDGNLEQSFSEVITKPEGYEKVEAGEDANNGYQKFEAPENKVTDDNGNSVTENSTWEIEKLAEGNGYKTTKTIVRIEESITVVDGAPEKRPDDAKDIDTNGSYEYTTTETLEDGRIKETKVLVQDGKTTTTTRLIDTKVTVNEVRKDGEETATLVTYNADGTVVSTTYDANGVVQASTEQEFEVDSSKLFPEKQNPPQDYKKVDGKENEYKAAPKEIKDDNGNKIGEENSTWVIEDITEGNKKVGYKTTKTTTTVQETSTVVDNVPENRPDNAIDIEGGYEYTTTETLADGSVKEVIVTVKNGQTTTLTRTITTVVTVEEVRVDSNGKVTLVIHKTDGDDEIKIGTLVNGEFIEGNDPEHQDFIVPDVTPNYGGEDEKDGMYDSTNDLYDREHANLLMTIKADINGEGEKQVHVFKMNSKGTGFSDSYENGEIKTGGVMYVYEERIINNGKLKVYRIDPIENAWVCASDVKLVSAVYKVITNQGYVYENHAVTGNGAPASRGKGAFVRVDEWYTDDKGVEWCHINSDGNKGGWILAKNLELQITPQPLTMTQKVEDGIHKDGYEYFYLGETGLESSIRVKIKGSTGDWIAHQFILRDKEMNQYYVYCAELGQDPQGGYDYKLIRLEDVIIDDEKSDDPNYIGHLNADKLQKIRAVAQNGYWATADGTSEEEGKLGSLKALKEKLEDAYSKKYNASELEIILSHITPGIAMTATQAALWYYGNTNGKSVNTDTDNWLQYLGTYYNYYPDKNKNYHGAASTFDKLNKNDKQALSMVFKWLTNLDEDVSGAKASEAITKEDFKVSEATVKVDKIDPVKTDYEANKIFYKANVEFALNVTSDENDDLVVQVIVKGDSNEELIVYNCPLAQKNDTILQQSDGEGVLMYINGKYIIRGIELPNGAKLDINLFGKKNLGKGVYIFKSEEKEGVHSQTFIGMAENDVYQKVDLTVTLDFDITEAKATVTTKTTTTTTEEKWSDSNRSEARRYKPDESGSKNPPSTTTTRERTTRVPNPVVPLANIPDPGVPLASIADTEVPLAMILDEDVPLAGVPKTGDNSHLWALLAMISGLGLAWLSLDGKRRGENAR